jgi:molecular chaperone HscA
VEAQTEAKILIDTTQSFLEKNSQHLTAEEMLETRTAIQKLGDLITKGNKDEIHQAIEELNGISRPYAERLMDEAIGKAMKGKKLTG